ncbi:hypothetical protein ANCDUO_07840 [Ancylostoma duodenale]|uniref:Uncharacterized protein n=1 Tax=Ancylostoma duodenale TaxID=51022 RepID=A0A0C2DHG9_9BILA|nr:hypothetical protein ANCDUO_07840 [Ancylostoma duodenale]
MTFYQVTDDIFHKDPCRLNHNCIALNRYKEKAERQKKREKVSEKFSRNSYEDRRRSFARASSAHKRKVEMENVPGDLLKLLWGEDFLQVQTRSMHIYYYYYSKENKQASEHLRRRDRLRQHKIDEAMDELQREMGARKYITTVTINNYCEGMSRYVTEKTI